MIEQITVWQRSHDSLWSICILYKLKDGNFKRVKNTFKSLEDCIFFANTETDQRRMRPYE